MKHQKDDSYLKACGILMIAAMHTVQLLREEKYVRSEKLLLWALERMDEPLSGGWPC